VFGEDLHDPPLGRQVLVDGQGGGVPLLGGCLVDGAEAVRFGFVGTEEPEVALSFVGPHHVTQELAEHPGRLGDRRARLFHFDAVVPEVGELQVPQEQPAVGVRAGPHPPGARRRQRHDLGAGPAAGVEELVGPVAPHPRLEGGEMPGVGSHPGQGHLMGPPRAFHRPAVHFGRARPALALGVQRMARARAIVKKLSSVETLGSASVVSRTRREP
jgi:hypothetical protein